MYRGDIRECIPFSVSHGVAGFSGESCRTVGRAEIAATVAGRGVHVDYRASRLRHASLSYGEWVWTNKPI
jgi:hypothetical protein